MADFRFSLPYKFAIKSGQVHWYRARDKKLMAELLQRIGAEGPLKSCELQTDTTKRAGWWDWKPAKKALERRLPRSSSRLLILLPFDNAVIQRDRLQALFQYDYRIECYLPAAADPRAGTADGVVGGFVTRTVRRAQRKVPRNRAVSAK